MNSRMDPVAVPPVLPQACLLTDLPTELLVEITTYHTDSFSFLSPLVNPEDVENRQAQRQDLCSLSQSCNALRSVCLPFLWARFDISGRNFDHLGRRTELGPHILSCIGSVHISMVKWSIPQQERMSNLPEFLAALPNLRAVRMYHVSSPTIGRALCSALANCCFPTVHSLSIPDGLYIIFPAFPNLTTLACPSIHLHTPLLEPAKSHLPRLDALVGMRLDSTRDFIATLARDFPHLRALSIASPIRPDDKFGLETLRAFTHLSELGLFHRPDPANVHPLEELVSAAKVVLQASQSPDTKVVRVWSKRHPPGPCLVYEERF